MCFFVSFWIIIMLGLEPSHRPDVSFRDWAFDAVFVAAPLCALMILYYLCTSVWRTLAFAIALVGDSAGSTVRRYRY